MWTQPGYLTEQMQGFHCKVCIVPHSVHDYVLELIHIRKVLFQKQPNEVNEFLNEKSEHSFPINTLQPSSLR